MALKAEVLTSYKKIDEVYIDTLLKQEIEKNNKKIVVLDDDPTGVQTVHDISVYTNWEKETICQGFEEKNNLFYITLIILCFLLTLRAVHRYSFIFTGLEG